MRFTIFGYEFIFRPIPKGLRFVTEEEYAERETQVAQEAGYLERLEKAFVEANTFRSSAYRIGDDQIPTERDYADAHYFREDLQGVSRHDISS